MSRATYRYCNVKGALYDISNMEFDDGTTHKEGCGCRKMKEAGYHHYKPTINYVSPVTGKEITDRGERRKELKAYGYREVDPSEFKAEYKNDRFAQKRGLGRSGTTTII